MIGRPGGGRRFVCGLVSGAAGTVALNLVSYLDMAARGRPASQVPTEVIGHLADDLGAGQFLDPSRGDQASARRSAFGLRRPA